MATKVQTSDLRMGMFVAELDRPWTDTPFLLQGFLIDSDEQIAELRKHCEYVIVDRARSVGKEFAADPEAARATPPPPGMRGAAPCPSPCGSPLRQNGRRACGGSRQRYEMSRCRCRGIRRGLFRLWL